ncbi:hypothetical protein [Rhizobium sp. NFACC06-2]|uniref:hypothetical protein n=1 Tax=Rhizobium sp. NFACC06-2 TaxID=1566264 RepID=UPI0008762717|nr:hypothetical protein [Rhizobium sp. NFACC06-2]SCY90362.1 hypothetical protein SAMN03159288_05094 [Rhizobium sp. NFACC06-2]
MAAEEQRLRRLLRKVKDVFSRKDEPENRLDKPLPPLPARQHHAAAKKVTSDQIGRPLIQGDLGRSDFLRQVHRTSPPELPTAAINVPPSSTYMSDQLLAGGMDDPFRVSTIQGNFRAWPGSGRSSAFSGSAFAHQPAVMETSRFSAWSTDSGVSDATIAKDEMFEGLDENPNFKRELLAGLVDPTWPAAQDRHLSPGLTAQSSALPTLKHSLSGSTLNPSASIEGLHSPDVASEDGDVGKSPDEKVKIYLDPALSAKTQDGSRKIVILSMRKASREEVKLVSITAPKSASNAARSTALSHTQLLRPDVYRPPMRTDGTMNRLVKVQQPGTSQPRSRSLRTNSDIEKELDAAHARDRDRTSLER